MANKYDKILGEYREDDAAGKYVDKTGDTMTGELIINSTGTTSLTANKDIVIKAGQKLILDGA